MIRWKRYVSPTVAALIALTVVTSLIVSVDARSGGRLYEGLALSPARVWRGELWRLATWILVARGPIALIFGCVALYWFGGDLAAAWGQRRLARFVVAIVLVAGVGTSLLALVLPGGWWFQHLGGWSLTAALVIAWALQFPDRRVVFYGVLQLGGTQLAYGTFVFAALCVLFFGLVPFLPELLAAAAALGHMTGSFRVPRRPSGPRHGPRERGPYATN